MILLVSREDHCLVDSALASRGELAAEIPFSSSNHPDHRSDVEAFGVGITTSRIRTSRAAETLSGADLMCSPATCGSSRGEFLAKVGAPIINIHHSFLPAFAGADPYRRAAERGVKIIGATAHYVTEELDAGPIIEQDVAREPPRGAGGDDADRPRHRAHRRPRRQVAPRGPRAVHGNRTVVF
jgi:formyltetrahydrofolate deformylase